MIWRVCQFLNYITNVRVIYLHLNNVDHTLLNFTICITLCCILYASLAAFLRICYTFWIFTVCMTIVLDHSHTVEHECNLRHGMRVCSEVLFRQKIPVLCTIKIYFKHSTLSQTDYFYMSWHWLKLFYYITT